MKMYIYLAVFCISVGYAQNYNDNSTVKTQDEIFFIDYTAVTAKKSVNNLVLVNQNGHLNSSDVAIKANESVVEIQQIGNENSVKVDVVADKVEERVIQVGDRNVFKDFNHMNKKYHGVDVYQEGENQRIYLRGNNSIMQKLKIKQIGDHKTIRINNYK